MPSFDTPPATHALIEFSTLVFARVTHVVEPEKEKKENETGEPTGATTGLIKGPKGPKGPKFYYGFAARIEKVDDEKQNTVWFKRNTHLNVRGGGFFAVGTSHAPDPDPAPERGDIVVGKIREIEGKGPMFTWWTHHARPFLEFTRILKRGPRALRNTGKAFALLKMAHTRSKTTDDLYVIARLVVLNDVNTLISRLFEPESMPRHPVKKDSTGHQRQRGFHMEFSPIEVAYYVAQFCNNKEVLVACIAHLNKHAEKVLEWPSQDLSDFTPERLENYFEKKGK